MKISTKNTLLHLDGEPYKAKNPVEIQQAITELTSYNEVDGKIYDVLGREWTCSFANLPKGLYIINNRKVLKTEQKCPERESNPHVRRTHDPQSCLSTNFSTWAI